MQTQDSKIDTGKAVDADLIITESSGTESEVQDDNSWSGNDTDADDSNIIPIYNEEPMVEYVFNANHDACIVKLLKEVNSHAKIQFHKTKNSNKPVDQKSHTQKPGRFDLGWKPTGRIFKSVGLRWISTGKLFDSCTSKVDSEPSHGSNVDILNIHECKQTLDFKPRSTMSAEVPTSNMIVMTSIPELESLFGPFVR
nr:hypothetical protein [Tanacetum cinerariifolium]